MGRIHFDPNELSANGPAKTRRDWSDLESRLRDLARPSSQAAASGLAVEPQVTLAHDPHDSLQAFEAFAGRSPPGAGRAPQQDRTEPKAASSPTGKAAPTPAEQPPQDLASKPDPLELLSRLAAISTSHS
ncbi:hypothetical protein [Bradyrhizobium stylosanthis]|uniref:hypothetical protein n=1 Tax=Bradyrhizobium stylosanthis TaxID=1803665 RepID=UPI0007C5793A|nr:hypothetical protein [Bradyrhizobium stylosanthis]